jgi:hypothetical protein
MRKEDYSVIFILQAHRCSNPQQNINKPNPTVYKMTNTPYPNGIYFRYTSQFNMQNLDTLTG